jgi:hypothetical protein
MCAVSKIEQPENINWLGIAPFTPSSRDTQLHKLAMEHKAKYKASTSSITGLFSHIYQVKRTRACALHKSFVQVSLAQPCSKGRKHVYQYQNVTDVIINSTHLISSTLNIIFKLLFFKLE